MNIALIGCGAISSIYLENLYRFPHLHLVALADLDPARAQAKAEKAASLAAAANKEAPQPLSIDQALAHKDVALILNLTVPKAHIAVATAALNAGKHTYSEKPIAIHPREAAAVLQLARSKNLRVGCAPDTFLGAGIQSARKLLDDGAIGTPVAATAFMLCPGHESWHPDPEFYYQVGGGPMLDMGPYYLTALVNLLGPVAKVAGFARATHPTRTITSEKKRGLEIPVETPTHFATSLQFASGPLASLVMSFDCFPGNLPRIEIYGTKGTLSIPDPNTFGAGGGELKLKLGRSDWQTLPFTHPYKDEWRALGVADMAAAITANRPHRASGELAAHVLDVMAAAIITSEEGRTIDIASAPPRPAPMSEHEL